MVRRSLGREEERGRKQEERERTDTAGRALSLEGALFWEEAKRDGGPNPLDGPAMLDQQHASALWTFRQQLHCDEALHDTGGQRQ
jgi:hypothetical protein